MGRARPSCARFVGGAVPVIRRRGMWKWIVGVLLVVVVALAGTCWYGYKKLTSGGDSAVVTIAATPARVFASLADPDSMQQWMDEGVTVTATRHGMLAVGDTLHVEQHNRTVSRSQQYTWAVSEVTPAHLLVLEMRNDSSGKVFATRRDSLVAAGDSTIIITTITSPMMDSIRNVRGDSGGKVRGAAIDFTSKILVSAFRELSRQELERLKTRLEGGAKPATPATPTRP